MKNFPLAAVPERETIFNLANLNFVEQNVSMIRKKFTTWENYFNFGLVVFNLKVFSYEKILDEMVRFLHDNPDITLMTQDAFNFLFSENYLKLPNRYNAFTRVLPYLKQTSLLESRIYHHAGNDYSLDPRNKIHQLFLKYFMRTPFCTPETLSNLVENSYSELKKVSAVIRQIANQLSTRARGFYCMEQNRPVATQLFEIKQNEIVIATDSKNSIDNLITEMQSRDKIFFIIDNYEVIGNLLKSRGFIENQDFFDAKILIRDKIVGVTNDLDKNFILNM